MKEVVIDLGNQLKDIEIHIFADEHIGDPLSDINRVKRRIEYVRNKPNAFAILNGDIMNNATLSSVSDTYGEVMSPMEQLETYIELFKPIKDKILCMTQGNHEARTAKHDGIDLTKVVAIQYGIEDRYAPQGAYLILRFGQMACGWKTNGKVREMCYTFYVTHGSGGGRKEGSKVNRLIELSNIVDADIYIMGHTHTPFVTSGSHFRVDLRNNKVTNFESLFVNNASNLSYGGYGETAGFKPVSNKSPIILLSGTKKEFKAIGGTDI